jgi:diguanylate cyclase (GGDEF)-like protein
MAHTIFILGTDHQQCKELREILQERISDPIVTTSSRDNLPAIQESDTVIITSEERNTGVLYRRLLNKLEEQVNRAKFLGDLIRLFSSSIRIEEILEGVVAKSTEVLGETAFIVLTGDEDQIRLEAAYSTDRDRLIKMLLTTIKSLPQGLDRQLLDDVLQRRQARLVPNLQQAVVPDDVRQFIEKYSLVSLIAVPIQVKDRLLGAFVSLSSRPEPFTEADLTTAAELSDFTAIAVENARLIAELQRSATTDSLTSAYNTRFFHEILGREAARADRYATPLSLLMLDVDGFKIVNDTYGHVVGNKVLINLARILERAVRNTDLVFRCGGDEFGVVLPGTNLEGAMKAAEKILQKVDTSDILSALGYSGPVTVSIGVSEYHRGSHFETLVAEADQALYASKRSSKNCARAFGR